MTNIPNPTTHLPFFLAGPGETDVFLIVVIVILITADILVGVFYFTLHALPEHMVGDARAGQLQLVSILSLIALFTHNNYFWIAALLVAAVRLPNFVSPIRSIARSLKQQVILMRSQNAESEKEI